MFTRAVRSNTSLGSSKKVTGTMGRNGDWSSAARFSPSGASRSTRNWCAASRDPAAHALWSHESYNERLANLMVTGLRDYSRGIE